jgi:hypothetical protein
MQRAGAWAVPPEVTQADISLPAKAAAAAQLRHLRAVERARERRIAHRRAVRAARRAAAAAAAQAAAQAAQAAQAPQQPAQSPAPAAQPAQPSYSGAGGFQSCVIAHESGGDPTAYNASSGASGLYGFLLSTWDSMGLGYPGGASTAPVSVQNEAFAKLYAEAGTAPWAGDGCA